jgi:diguanylate cyclase (GGDEF)-like protein
LLVETRQKVQQLEGRDFQLWSISALVILVLAAGLVALILPNVMWHLGTLRLDGRYVPQVFFGFMALIVLLNLYTFERRQVLRDARQELFRQLVRTEASERRSLIDPVTEIFTREYLDRILDKEVSRTDRLRSSLTFLLVDVEGFKSLNKRYGQLVGDRVLNAVGQSLLETFRGSHTVMRYGGDEFLVVLSETDERQAERAVERLLAKVESWNRDNSLPGYRLNLSCGLATYKKGANVSKLLDAAEQRMNIHKTARSTAR